MPPWEILGAAHGPLHPLVALVGSASAQEVTERAIAAASSKKTGVDSPHCIRLDQALSLRDLLRAASKSLDQSRLCVAWVQDLLANFPAAVIVCIEVTK